MEPEDDIFTIFSLFREVVVVVQPGENIGRRVRRELSWESGGLHLECTFILAGGKVLSNTIQPMFCGQLRRQIDGFFTMQSL